jgi:putative ABC transport system permease protein
MKIVGVTGDVKQGALGEAIEPHTYTPLTQADDSTLADGITNILRAQVLVVRTSGDPAMTASALRGELAALDPSLPVAKLQTMEQVIDESVGSQRFSTMLLSIFAAAALFLASIGIYGVLAYSVTQRTHEIGVRMALGARRGDVLNMVVRQGLTLAAGGLAIGLAVSLVATRAMTGMLYGVSASDPATFAAVLALLCCVAALASYLPARRATKVDPIVALRYE